MSILGTRVARVEDPRFLTVGGTYVDDILMPGAVWATFVRSVVAHGDIVKIDVAAASKASGVLGVFVADDLDLGHAPLDFPALPDTMPRPLLAGPRVRYVGEPVAVVVTGTRAQGEDAAELVDVEYEMLDAVTDPVVALTGNVLLFPELGTNVCMGAPDDDVDLSGCEVVVRQRVVNQRVAPGPLETQAATAHWTEDGRLEVWSTSQGPHPYKAHLARIYDLDPNDVRVVSPDVGGGFGAKTFITPELIMLPWLSRRVTRPVRWTETRSESMVNLGHGRVQVHDIVIGGRCDGTVLAYDLTVIQDCGAYPKIAAFLPALTKMMHPGTYTIERTKCRFSSVVTNTNPVGAYRGAGRPEAAAAIERAMDLFAVEIDMDPAEVRRKNLVAKGQVSPYTTTAGTVYDSGDYEQALDLVLERAGYGALRARQKEARDRNDTVQIGIGLATYVEVTALTGGSEFEQLEILADGTARVVSGTSPHGQGHVTSWAMLVSERTGIPIEAIEVVHGDTDAVPFGGTVGGSRSVQIAGTTLWRAAGAIVDRARELAATLLEADPADIVIDTDRACFHVSGTPAITLAWADIAQRAAADGEPLLAQGEFALPASGTYPSGAHLAVVEVDTETGEVRLVRIVAVDDCGRVLNPLLAEGQVHGGLAQGIAQAMYEEVVFDDQGNPQTTNFADYAFVSAPELPSFETYHVETPSPLNDLGAKGIGESGSIGATPAVHNAVVDALTHLGIRNLPMPATPERVWRANPERLMP